MSLDEVENALLRCRDVKDAAALVVHDRLLAWVSPELPIEPIFLILGIDELMDMARTSVNVIGNCLATVVIARWEGEFGSAAVSSGTPVVEAALPD